VNVHRNIGDPLGESSFHMVEQADYAGQMDTTISGQTITAVERTAEVLTAFARADSQTLGVTEIAQELEISKAVVHRILNSLRAKGFIEIEPESRRYLLGPTALAVGLAFLRHVDVRELARPVLRDLGERTEETATLSIRSGWNRIYIDQVTPPREVKMTVALGRSFPLHAGSSSKVLLAYLSPEEIDEYLSIADFEALTELTITDPDRLRDELDQIRSQGYARSLGERQSGAGSVAAAILDHSGRAIASMSLCGPIERFRAEMDKAAELIVAAGQRLSSQMGYRRLS
jgi:DNA-binding IclR family transcriptional regulator